ncbi:hypothetical protein L3049_07975 [Labilibaculum sp. DW002]|uniref:MalT-like TPR region domain-containing protein n=1 Tax=Paralabilibaculum antarcticum TaxID=2912572 RepID=A0ABT5VTX8_9BACT|nr:hypothetical protein [Labilibaculum sp. DW002]MDE5417943.1 hypothetical protein [Labilibaculum sp. DW002]
MKNIFAILFTCLLLVIGKDSNCQNQIENQISIIEDKLYFHPAEGEMMLEDLISKTGKDEFEKYYGQVNFLFGLLAYKKAEQDNAIDYLEKALITFVNNENELYQGKAQLILGWLAERIGYWQQSKIHYYKVIDLVNKKNKREQGLAYLGLARCKNYLREAKGNDLQKGTGLLNSMEVKEYSLYAEFLNLLIKKSNNETPGKLLNIADEYEKLDLYTNAASVYKVLAQHSKKLREWNVAHNYLDKALGLAISDYPSTSLLPSLFQLKGLVYFYQGDYEDARLSLNKSLTLSEEYNQDFSKYYAYKALCRIDTLMGDYKSGFTHLVKANENHRSNDRKAEKQLARLMETSLNLITLEEENTRLKSQTKNILLMLLGAVVVLFFSFSIIGLKFKLKNKEKLEKAKEKKLALQSLLVGLGEKRSLLGYKENALELQKRMDTNSLFHDDFEECYPESINKIESAYPQLTRSDARYAVMFSLKLPDDVIAEIKNVNPDSIRKTKFRMRKKLSLETGCDLGHFFSSALKLRQKNYR